MESNEFVKICRLCLSVIETELDKNLHESGVQMMELCLPEMDLATCCDSVLCSKCFQCLKQIYLFKMKCLRTEEKLRLYLENSDPQKCNLRHVLECLSNSQEENAEICRSCLGLSNECVSVQVDESNCDPILKNMFTTCIPEMDLNLLNDTIICSTCDNSLKQFYSFKSRCLQVEEEIYTFKEEFKVQMVNLSELISHNRKEIIFENINSDNKVKHELGEFEERKVTFEDAAKSDEFKITKEKTVELVDTENLKSEIHLKEGQGFPFINCGWNGIKEETMEEVVNDTDLSVRLQVLSQNATNPLGDTITWYTCDICSYQSKWKNHLERHKQVHEDSNSNKTFTCVKCGFVSKYKHALLKHSTLEHGFWFKCEDCEYQTKWKRCYNQHLLTHKGGLTWHQCEICSYRTKWKYHLKRHMVKHQ